MTLENIQKEAIEKFDFFTEDIELSNPICCERHDCLCNKITQREMLHNFISEETKTAYQRGKEEGEDPELTDEDKELIRQACRNHEELHELR